MGEPTIRCHPKLADRLRKMLGDDAAVAPLEDDETVTASGASLRALFTPGHEVDHVCYYLESDGVMFTGDTVLGASINVGGRPVRVHEVSGAAYGVRA